MLDFGGGLGLPGARFGCLSMDSSVICSSTVLNLVRTVGRAACFDHPFQAHWVTVTLNAALGAALAAGVALIALDVDGPAVYTS